MTIHRLTRRDRSRGRRRIGRNRLPADGSRRPVRARRIAAGPRRYRDPWRQRVDHGREARRFRERRRPHPQWRHCRGRRGRRRARCGGDRGSRTDLHAGLRRYALAPLDQHAAALCPLRYRRAERFPGLHPPRAAHDAAGCLCQREARHRRGAERRRDHGAQLGAQHAELGARRRGALCDARLPAFAAASLTARHRACRTTSRWTSKASPASSAPGCPATACSRWASARAMSEAAASAARRAGSFRSTWRGKTGTAPARSACRSRCTPPARARSRRSRTPACSAPTCSSCTRC